MDGVKKTKFTENTEIWKDIEGYEGYYQVSSKGRVRSLTRRVYNYTKPGRILKLGVELVKDMLVLFEVFK